MLAKLVILGICITPVVCILFQIFHQRQKYRLESRSPFPGLLMRPAGESVRLKIQELDDRLYDHLLFGVGLPVVYGVLFLFIFPSQEKILPLLVVGGLVVVPLVGITFFFWGRRIPSLIREIRDHELGFQGERYVGEELNQLLKEGFRIFHDLPFDGFNIDHVIVGPQGVYAIETKTRRKPVSPKGKPEYKIVFDGARLNFPWGWDTHGLEQAKRNADHLATWLSSATGEKVKVEAVLTFPGWWIERTGRHPVHVVNTKEIPRIFRNKPSILSPEQIQRICHQIEQKCRNIEV